MRFSRTYPAMILAIMLVGILPQLSAGLFGTISTSSSASSQATASLNSIDMSTYGVGLSGAPVVLDQSTLASMTGGPETVQAFDTLIEEYFVPMEVKLVFIDPGWDNDANTSTTLVAGGYEQWLANWLQATYAYGIDNIFFTKQFGYYFSAPSWDQDFLNAYPDATTANSNGNYVALTNCAGCTSSSGWTITSPFVYRQYEEDLEQLFTWYGNYTNWVGFGEGATGDRNEYVDATTALKTARPWDNGTMYDFANSIFFQRSINSSGYYLGTNTLSKIWSMFLADRPDIDTSTGVALVSSYPFSVYGGTGAGGYIMMERFYVPFGETLNGFQLESYVSSSGDPTSKLYVTIYPDQTSNALPQDYTGPVLSSPIQNESVNGVTSTAGWISTSFTATLIGGNYYWAVFTAPSSGTSSANSYNVYYDLQNVYEDIYTESSTDGFSHAVFQPGGSVLQILTTSNQPISVYPFLSEGNNQPSQGAVDDFEVSGTVSVNMLSFFTSDRAYDPNDITVYLQYTNGTTLATGTLSEASMSGAEGLTDFPIQLSKTVTLYSSIEYQITFSSLTGDNYAGSAGGGITQDFITETANPSSAGYLGQSTWTLFEVGLMNIEPNGISNLNYESATDLFSSPGYVAGSEIGMRFEPTASEILQQFEINTIGVGSLSQNLQVFLRADNETCQGSVSGSCSHPSESTLASGTISMSTINSELQSCPTTTGVCAFAEVSFSGSTSLTANTYYWLVMNVTGNSKITFLRLVSPYKNLVYYSTNNFATEWGVPPDGPSDLSYKIITSGQDFTNTVLGQTNFELGPTSLIGQQFTPSESFQLKGVWMYVSTDSDQDISVSIESNGAGHPSGTVLATGIIPFNATGESFNYASLNVPLNLTSGTTYWIVENSTCVSSSSCSGAAYAYVDVFGSDYSMPFTTYQTDTSGSWVTPSQQGNMLFILAGSNSTIKTYDTSTLYNEVSTYEDSAISYAPIGQWNTFLDYTESQMMYNLTQSMSAYFGRSLVWLTGMPSSITSLIPGVNYQHILTQDSGSGGPIGCPPSSSSPSCESQGSTPTFWPGDVQDLTDAIISNPGQNTLYPWASFGSTQDNQGDLSPTELRTYYDTGLPMFATNILTFNDWAWGTSYDGLNNVTQTQYPVAFGTILSRMAYTGSYFGTSKDAVRLLYLGGSGDGFFPEFLTSAVNVTYDYEDSNLDAFAGSINQFNVVAVDPGSLSPSGLAILTNFVKDGGGLIETDFGVNSGSQDNFLGLKSSSVSASPTSALTITQSNDITSPYSSVSWSAYWLRYGISTLSNESATVLVKDSNGNPYITVNNYYSGKAVLIETPYDSPSQMGNSVSFDGQTFGSPRDSWVSLFINAVYYAAGEQSMLPIIWENSYSDQQNWSPYLQFSIDGTPGQPVLLWLSSNDSSSSSFSINLNANFYGISTQGWIAIDMQNMQVVASGTGSEIDISTTVPAYSWAPIYIMNDSSSTNLQPLYSTATILSSSSSSGSLSLATNSPQGASNWLILSSGSAPNSISSSLEGSLSSYSSLSSLNMTQIGYSCASVSNSACTSWSENSQQGYYYDPTNDLLYAHYIGGNSVTLSVSSSDLSTSTSTTTITSTQPSSSSSSTSTSSSSSSSTQSRSSSSSTQSSTTSSTTSSSSTGTTSPSSRTTTSSSPTTTTSTTSSSTTSTTLTTQTSTTSTATLGSISIQVNAGPYVVGTPISLSGGTVSTSGSVLPSQTIYVWINGQNQGPFTSSSSGSWTFSFTPTTAGTYYASASQNSNGGGITSQQLVMTVQSVTTTTTTTTTASSTSTSSSSTTTASSTSSSTTVSSASTSSSTSSQTTIATSTTSTMTSTVTTSSSASSSTTTEPTTTTTSTQPSTSATTTTTTTEPPTSQTTTVSSTSTTTITSTTQAPPSPPPVTTTTTSATSTITSSSTTTSNQSTNQTTTSQVTTTQTVSIVSGTTSTTTSTSTNTSTTTSSSTSQPVTTNTSTTSSTASVSSSSQPSSSATNTSSSSPTNSTSSETISAISTSSQASVTNSSTTSQVSGKGKPTSLASYFDSIPYVTTNSPTPIGTLIFAIELGLATGAPFVIRKIAKRAKEKEEESHDWQW